MSNEGKWSGAKRKRVVPLGARSGFLGSLSTVFSYTSRSLSTTRSQAQDMMADVVMSWW